MEFGLFDGGKGVEYSGVGLAEISQIFMMQDAYFFGTTSFDKI